MSFGGRTANGPFGHDAINRFILCEARCKRLGLPYRCETCGGDATVYTEPTAHLGLVLWMLHPRKGASRGVDIERVAEGDMPKILAFLAEAAQRNAKRFAAVCKANKKPL